MQLLAQTIDIWHFRNINLSRVFMEYIPSISTFYECNKRNKTRTSQTFNDRKTENVIVGVFSFSRTIKTIGSSLAVAPKQQSTIQRARILTSDASKDRD